jgi:predicted ATP-dependent endonuclease of OLD family
MKLTRYRVTDFRSVKDSGWIDCDDVTTLIGVNEAGKSNLLLALWKLKPAQGGAINLLQDIPRSHYSEWRDAADEHVFIKAVFELSSGLIRQIVALSNAIPDNIKQVEVSRQLDGVRIINFPDASTESGIPSHLITNIIDETAGGLSVATEVGKGETGIKGKSEAALTEIRTLLEATHTPSERIQIETLDDILDILERVATSDLKTSTIAPLMARAMRLLGNLKISLNKPAPHSIEAVRNLIVEKMPSFVYYSNYGNLDSEIYLPYVIENLSRKDLGSTTEAKTRTLRVLFDFVKLDPKEILKLGSEAEPTTYQGKITDVQIQEVADKKKERDILLQSASTLLTQKFRAWWKQGDYTFRFAADGSYFRIWVSDNLRADEIELENRSTGLQWFLSFYLVFLVESQEAHSGAIILLDEAGLSLHPLAQKDLSKFFEHLAVTNQIINTTHSPFLIDTDHIDRAKVVYVDDDGFTITSGDLKAPQAEQVRLGRSVYAVHAALNLSISEVFLQGCLSVIVEGPSDQFYLSAIKLYLIGQKLIAPQQEIVFVPSGGVKGIQSLASILSTKENKLPYVLLDSDKSGVDMRAKLLSGLYQGDEEHLLLVHEFNGLAQAEIEDLFPLELLKVGIDKIFRTVDDEVFEDVYDAAKPIVNQIEQFAAKHAVTLPKGWKVELARQTKIRVLQRRWTPSEQVITVWTALFNKLQ